MTSRSGSTTSSDGDEVSPDPSAPVVVSIALVLLSHAADTNTSVPTSANIAARRANTLRRRCRNLCNSMAHLLHVGLRWSLRRMSRPLERLSRRAPPSWDTDAELHPQRCIHPRSARQVGSCAGVASASFVAFVCLG